LAIHLTQLAESAKRSAVLEERNRLAGEIHDSLAESFAAVCMQLGSQQRRRKTSCSKALTLGVRAGTGCDFKMSKGPPRNRETLSNRARFGCGSRQTSNTSLDGLQLQRRLKEIRPSIPVIFFSAHAGKEEEDQALRSGAVAFLRKPVHRDVLLRVIRMALERTS
jgi:CheY-like chemotaxis protein